MSIQLLIIILYFAATVVIGVLAGKRSAKSGDSFHGAGMGILAIVAASTTVGTPTAITGTPSVSISSPPL